MNKLSEIWFAEGYIDFELKKYTLLAYLQQVSKLFDENRLYPQLADLIFHYNNLLQFKRNKDFLKNRFPKRLTGVDLQRITALYEGMIDDDGLMQEMEEIISFSLKSMRSSIEDGAVIYDMVEHHLELEPVGLVPPDVSEGYFLLRVGKSDAHVYGYRSSIFDRHKETYRSLSTRYVATWQLSYTVSPESIKSELVKNSTTLSVPAVYYIASQLNLPLDDTLLPVAKRVLARHISEGVSS